MSVSLNGETPVSGPMHLEFPRKALSQREHLPRGNEGKAVLPMD
jgi:hypothetical protein